MISQRDSYFGGPFDAGKLEGLLNKLASDGWRLVSAATADVSNGQQEIVLFLER